MAKELPETVIEFIEVVRTLGTITTRRMFGGTGIYHNGHMFALEAYGELYLKVDDMSRAAFEAAGSGPFIYRARAKDGSEKTTTMNYYRLPESAVDDREQTLEFASLAIEAAERTATPRR